MIRSAAVLLAAALATVCPVPSHAAAMFAPAQTDVRSLVTKAAPALVTVRFILRGEQDIESEVLGTVIDPAGLVVLSNEAFQGPFGPFGPAQTPADIKVLVGDDTEGLDATFLARDTELGLAWVQLKEPPATPLTAVEFAADATPEVGDPIFVVSLMGKFFDRVPAVAAGHVGSVTTKPRTLYVPSIGMAGGELGLPVFDGAGQAVGLTTFIFPDEEELRGTPGGPQVLLRGTFRVLVLPAADVLDATRRAKESPEPAPETPADGGDTAVPPATEP